MDANTILELEALKTERDCVKCMAALTALGPDITSGLLRTITQIENEFNSIAARIRALKTDKGNSIDGEYPQGMTIAELNNHSAISAQCWCNLDGALLSERGVVGKEAGE